MACYWKTHTPAAVGENEIETCFIYRVKVLLVINWRTETQIWASQKRETFCYLNFWVGSSLRVRFSVGKIQLQWETKKPSRLRPKQRAWFKNLLLSKIQALSNDMLCWLDSVAFENKNRVICAKRREHGLRTFRSKRFQDSSAFEK